MTVKDYIKTVPMYGQQVIRITNEDEDNLATFEYRMQDALDNAVAQYGEYELEHASSETGINMPYGKVDAIVLTINNIEDDETCPQCGR